MVPQKMVQIGLWVANGAIALAIVVLSLVWFVFSKPPDALANLQVATAPRRGPVTNQPDRGSSMRLQAAASMPNPLEPQAAPVAIPAEQPLSQFLSVSSTSAPILATIVMTGTQYAFIVRISPEGRGDVLNPTKLPANVTQREYLTGWTVVEINGYPDESVVLERNGVRETLSKKPAATAGAGGIPAAGPIIRPGQMPVDLTRYRGQPYNAAQYQSYQRGATWFVDAEELNWVRANSDTVLQTDVRLSPAEGGGVRVDWVKTGSVLEARGLAAGDIVTEINRRRIEGPQQMNELRQWLLGENPQQVYIRLNRAGRAIVLVYREAPPAGR